MVLRKPSPHEDHPKVINCRLAALKAINQMKTAVKHETKNCIQYFYRIYPISVTVPYRYFAKIPLRLKVKLFTYRDMQFKVKLKITPLH